MEAGTLDRAVHVKDLQAATLEHLGEWSSEGKALLKTAKALGIDGTELARFEGTVPTTGGSLTGGGGGGVTRRGRSTRRRRSRTGSNGAGTITTEQIVSALQEHGPMNQSQLATMFKVTRQTIAKRLTDAGPQVRKQGKGAKMTWRAQELASV